MAEPERKMIAPDVVIEKLLEREAYDAVAVLVGSLAIADAFNAAVELIKHDKGVF